MRIGILTASRTNNNGTDLQAYAMQTLFLKVNSESEIIDYVCDKLERSHLILTKLSLGNLLRIPWRIFNNISHESFREKYIKRSLRKYNKDSINENDYDVIVVGSDQIWNLDITGNDLSFFLPFDKPKMKKYSYAASIGKTDITQWNEKHNLQKLLKDFSGVSVREESAVETLADINITARYNLDPILCMEDKDWEKIELKRKKTKPYVLLYLVEQNIKAIEYAVNYAKKRGLKVIWVSNSIKLFKGISIKRFVSLERWMQYVKNAELVITNSYHGLSFAISQEKEFRLFLLQNNTQSNTRMKCLVERLFLENSIVYDIAKTDELNLDWSKAKESIKKERINSLEYIKKIASGKED